MFNIDADLSNLEKGVWAEYRGSNFLIAHTSSPKFQRSLARHQLPVRRKLNEGTLDPEKNKEIVARAMSESILLDWKDVVDGDKKAVPYTPELAFKALMRDPEFRDFVTEFAMAISNFRDAEVSEMGEASSVG
mgnify:CR=1 FL=1